MMPAFVDKYLNKFTSRKLTVWMVSTVALFLGTIDQDTWGMISLGYIGIQGFADLTTFWKKNRTEI